MGLINNGWYSIFVVCWKWCLIDVSSVSPSSEQTFKSSNFKLVNYSWSLVATSHARIDYASMSWIWSRALTSRASHCFLNAWGRSRYLVLWYKDHNLNCLFQIELSINRMTFLRVVGSGIQRNVRLMILREQIEMCGFSYKISISLYWAKH